MTPARRRLHRLAVRLGRSVEEVEQMTAREFREWLAFDAPAPITRPTSILDLFRKR